MMRGRVAPLRRTVKKVEAERCSSDSDAKMVLVDYIEVFYNQRRRHATLGQISPAAFERQAAAQGHGRCAHTHLFCL